jgi:hypothetical protein
MTAIKRGVITFLIGVTVQTVALKSPVFAFSQQAPSASSAENKKPDSQTNPQPQRPNPDSSGVYHPGDGVTPATLSNRSFPKSLERKRSAATAKSLLLSAQMAPRLTYTSRNQSLTRYQRRTGKQPSPSTSKQSKQWRSIGSNPQPTTALLFHMGCTSK